MSGQVHDTLMETTKNVSWMLETRHGCDMESHPVEASKSSQGIECFDNPVVGVEDNSQDHDSDDTLMEAPKNASWSSDMESHPVEASESSQGIECFDNPVVSIQDNTNRYVILHS
jgi:hypothetical protein